MRFLKNLYIKLFYYQSYPCPKDKGIIEINYKSGEIERIPALIISFNQYFDLNDLLTKEVPKGKNIKDIKFYMKKFDIGGNNSEF